MYYDEFISTKGLFGATQGFLIVFYKKTKKNNSFIYLRRNISVFSNYLNFDHEDTFLSISIYWTLFENQGGSLLRESWMNLFILVFHKLTKLLSCAPTFAEVEDEKIRVAFSWQKGRRRFSMVEWYHVT